MRRLCFQTSDGRGIMTTMTRLDRISWGARTDKAVREWRTAREALLRKRRRMLHVYPVASEVCPDPMDEASEREEEAVWLAILDRSRDMQAIAEEALHRLDAGKYGLCTGCGHPVGPARLRALPFAVRCLGCQEELERRAEANARRAAGQGVFRSRYEEHASDLEQTGTIDM